jgi:hypothetical protein
MGLPLPNRSNKPKSLEKLTAKWYKKLADEGFDDIEQDEDNLKQWHSIYFIARHTNFVGKSSAKEVAGNHGKLSAVQFESQQEYYQLAGAFLYEHKFKNDREKLIWELHASGLPTIEIYQILKERKLKVYRDGLYKVINELAATMVKQCQPKKT